MSRAVFAGGARTLPFRDGVIECGKFWRGIFYIVDVLAHELLRPIAKQVDDARTYKCVLPVEIKAEERIRELFKKRKTELFLAAQPALHGTCLGDVNQRALVADDSSIFHHAA